MLRRRMPGCLFVVMTLFHEWPLFATPGMKLTLSAERDRLAIYEALPITVTIESDGSGPLRDSPDVFTQRRYGHVEILEPSGKRRIVKQPVLQLIQLSSEPSLPVTLLPGQQTNLEVLLSCDWEGQEPIFVSHGEYALSVVFDDTNVSARSKSITVIVLAPPPEEKEALAAMLSLPEPCAIYAPELVFTSPRGETRTPALERLAEMPGSTLYASYGRLALGKGYLVLAEHTVDKLAKERHLMTSRRWIDSIDARAHPLGSEVIKTRRRLEELVGDTKPGSSK